ncbi:MAG: NAD kinase [Saprospiraceae bacterium]|nr:NAD kinase [Saprospiraceae bacterium]MCB9321652.1 NAD kinase [Lewinellaceae bacterium]
MKVILFGQTLHPEDIPVIRQIIQTIQAVNGSIYVYGDLMKKIDAVLPEAASLKVIRSHRELKKHELDMLFSLGGDGTILKAATFIRDAGVPILGINLGRLGFLATMDKHDVSKIIPLLNANNYTVESRTLLGLECNKPLFGDTQFALNDFTITKRDNSSMIMIRTFLDGEYLNTYWADGLIVATPTGSTGYSLSCGGPIILPDSNSFVITPVAPHNLTARPIVVPDNVTITFEVEGRTENFLCTLDSRFEPITADHHISIRKAPFEMHLIKLAQDSILDTIREKLNWGKDLRN